MKHGSTIALLALLLVAGSASASIVGPLKGRPVAGRPLEVNIPFAMDEARERACASANVRYGRVAVPLTLHVQGRGLRRNLLVVSHANVDERPVTVNVRVGCGPRAVTRSFVLAADVPVARAPAAVKPARKRIAPEFAIRPAAPPVAVASPGEPLFPPPAAEALPHEEPAAKADAPLLEDLHKARAEAATALAQLQATRNELAAVLDVERRTSQTLINAERQVREAESEVARMRAVLKWIAAGLALAAAGAAWFEFQRVAARIRMARDQPQREPTILSGNEMASFPVSG